TEGFDGDGGTQNHDTGFDVPLRPRCRLQVIGSAQEEVSDDETDNHGENVTHVAHAQGPGDAVPVQLVGGGGDVGIFTENNAHISDGEDDGKTAGKPFHITPHDISAETGNRQQEQISKEERGDTGHSCIIGGDGSNGFGNIYPGIIFDNPSQQVNAENGS